MPPLYHPVQQSPIPDASGIYKIVCITTGRFYIGSAIDLRQRYYSHVSLLRRSVHDNIILQRAWNKYGSDAFVFEVLELVLPISLIAREQYWFDKLKPFGKRGFNLDRVAGSRYGTKHSLKTREQMKISHLGQKPTEETIKKRLLTYPGRPMSPEERITASNAKASKMKALIVTSPDGEVQTIRGIKKFCKEQHLHSGHLTEVAKGKYLHHKGWKARYPEIDVS